MAQMWLWFVAGVAYVIIGIFTCLSARRLHLIDTQTLAKYNADYFSDDDIEKMKHDLLPVLMEKQKLANERKISSQEWGQWIKVCNAPYELEANKREAENFNKAAKINRGVLYTAAGSFFIAASISIAQGLSLL